MNTLVAYDSSSEEDESRADDVVPKKPDHASVSEETVQVADVTSPAADDAPLVGPSIPLDMARNYTGYEVDDLEHSPTSERDAIRYLTQASHPMTVMPPSPPGSPNPESSAKFRHFLRLKAQGIHFNEDLARKSVFKNPAMLQTLMNRVGLDETSAYRTSLPLDVLNTKSLPASGYKEVLLQSQQTVRSQEDAEKKSLAITGKRNIEFTSGGISAGSSATTTPGSFHKRQRQ